ncbi:MAG: EamA family transporter [Candidatus Nanoarchaeia archaeon]
MATALWAVGLVVTTGVASAIGAILLKIGSDRLKLTIRDIIKNYHLIIGVIFYAVSVFMFVPALKGGDISVLYPLISLNYIWVALLSSRYLGERMNRQKWLAIVLIILGVTLIGIGS